MENNLLKQKIEMALENGISWFPHIAGIAAAVDLRLDERVPTAAITPTGKVLISPKFVAELDQPGLTFMLMHEFYHALYRSAERIQQTSPDRHRLANIAHDCLINEMLRKVYAAHGEQELIPEGTPFWEQFKEQYHPGMDRKWKPVMEYSFEELVLELDYLGKNSNKNPNEKSPQSDLPEILTSEQERQLFPDMSRETQESLEKSFNEKIDEIEKKFFPDTKKQKPSGTDKKANGSKHQQETTKKPKKAKTGKPGKESDGPLNNIQKEALRTQMRQMLMGMTGSNVSGMQIKASAAKYPVELEEALQSMEDEYAFRRRTYYRMNRRDDGKSGFILKGSQKENDITLNIIVDTSGSMYFGDLLSKLFGIIESLCISKNIENARILQCDTGVTSDETIAMSELHNYQIKGGGGSDMSPAMLKLAKDPSVKSVIILTDGYISYPDVSQIPYDVWWGLTSTNEDFDYFPFKAPYGRKLNLAKYLS